MCGSPRTTAIVLGLAFVLGACALCPNVACGDGRKKGRGGSGKSADAKRKAVQSAISQLQAELAVAKRVNAEASRRLVVAQSQGGSVRKQHQWAGGALVAARNEVESAAMVLAEIEADLLGRQDPASEYGTDLARYEKARERYQSEVDKALATDEYRARHREAVGSRDKVTLLARARSEALEASAGVRAARAELKSAKSALDRTRAELLGNNPEWSKASEVARKAASAVGKAERDFKNSSLHKGSASANVINAARVVATTNAVIKRNTADIKKLQAELKKVAKQAQQRNKHSRSRR